MALFGCQASTEQQQSATIEEQLMEVYQNFDLMGLSVGLIANGEVELANSFGWANQGLQQSMTPKTYLRIASISKLYTALAVMTLWEKGLVKLDTPVSVYLGWNLMHPRFPDQPITLRHLMDHRSGIRDGNGYSQFLGDMFNERTHIRTLFMPDSAYFTEDMFSEHPPGSFFSYTNCTWGLVATIIERISKQRFDRYCKEHLFQPMGINSSFNVTDISANEIATLYRYPDSTWVAQVDDYSSESPKERAYEGYVNGTNGLIYGPQGNLRTSLHDLCITAKMLLDNGKVGNNSIIKSATLSYFQQDPWVFDGDNGETWNSFWHSYARGMHFLENRPEADIIFPDRLMWGHPGIAYGLLSDFYIDPETRSGVIFITNGRKGDYKYANNSSFYQVEEAVFQVLYPHLNSLESK